MRHLRELEKALKMFICRKHTTKNIALFKFSGTNFYDGNVNNTRNLSLIENRYLVSSFLKISDIPTNFVFHSQTPKCLHSNQNLYISYLSAYVINWCIFSVNKNFLNFVSTKSFRPTLDRSKKICLSFHIFF